MATNGNKIRHILSLSGGKDSTALAIHMRDRIPDMEYAFCDTGKELPETYEYLNKIEAYLGKPIARLNSGYSFDHWLEVYSGFLPSARMRWCTKTLKIKPFEKYCGDDEVYSYIGLRADEDRQGYISSKPNITPKYPFREDGINKADVFRILEESGLGVPDYYSWRTRSGCYFCFFQRKAEWVGLEENHPELFEAAKAYEKTMTPTGERYTWAAGESLDELSARKTEIIKNYQDTLRKLAAKVPSRPLIQVFDSANAEFDGAEPPCVICDL
jgi:3'-phosphoadenosine 5'-phosphosulfate sulfotransferase (PAPS reductase)/FAD synthetase